MKTSSWALAAALLFFSALPALAADRSSCAKNGKKLYGRVKVVKSFADFRVQEVASFPDLNVQRVDSFPDSCGKWQFVDSFPDFTIELVDSFPDLKIRYVRSHPGIP